MTTTDSKSVCKVGYLTDDNGNPSSMRLMSVGCVLAAVLFGGISMYLGKSDPGVDLVLIFLGAGLAPKTFQKFAEQWKPK